MDYVAHPDGGIIEKGAAATAPKVQDVKTPEQIAQEAEAQKATEAKAQLEVDAQAAETAAKEARAKADELKGSLTDDSDDEDIEAANEAETAAVEAEASATEARAKVPADQ